MGASKDFSQLLSEGNSRLEQSISAIANLIIAAKGGAVELEEERDEWGTVVQEAERLTGLALAKRCRAAVVEPEMWAARGHVSKI